jgi:hypothetical protein
MKILRSAAFTLGAIPPANGREVKAPPFRAACFSCFYQAENRGALHDANTARRIPWLAVLAVICKESTADAPLSQASDPRRIIYKGGEISAHR